MGQCCEETESIGEEFYRFYTGAEGEYPKKFQLIRATVILPDRRQVGKINRNRIGTTAKRA